MGCVTISEQTDLHFTIACCDCMPRTALMQARACTCFVGVVDVCLQVLSSWKFKPHLTPLQFTMNPAARPDAVLSKQQVHVEVSVGNRRLVETQIIHVPRYVAIQQCIAKPAIICLQWRYPLLFNPLFGKPVCHDHPMSQVAQSPWLCLLLQGCAGIHARERGCRCNCSSAQCV